MRTLGSQVRLRRLIRTFGDGRERIERDPGNRSLARAVERRLMEQMLAFRAAWDLDVQAARPDTRNMACRHVKLVLVAMESLIVRLGQLGTDCGRLGGEFREIALPLMFYLRGLEEIPEDQVISLLAS